MLVSSLRGLVVTYWFAFQVLGAAFGIQAILKGWLGWDLDALVLSSAFALLQIVLGVVGFHALRSASVFTWPLGLGLCALVVYLFLASGDPSYTLASIQALPGKQQGLAMIAIWASMIFGVLSPMSISSADVTRYARSRRDIWIGIPIGVVLGISASVFVGAYTASATGISNPFSAAAQLSMTGIIPFVLILGILVSILSVNIFNIYIAGMSLVNIAPKMGRFWSTIAAGMVALIISLLPTVVFDAEMWVREIGSVFGPLGGVFLADYVVIRKGFIDVDALFGPGDLHGYFHGVNLLAIAAAGGAYLSFRLLPAWSVPSIGSFVLSAAFYVAAARISTARTPKGPVAHEGCMT